VWDLANVRTFKLQTDDSRSGHVWVNAPKLRTIACPFGHFRDIYHVMSQAAALQSVNAVCRDELVCGCTGCVHGVSDDHDREAMQAFLVEIARGDKWREMRKFRIMPRVPASFCRHVTNWPRLTHLFVTLEARTTTSRALTYLLRRLPNLRTCSVTVIDKWMHAGGGANDDLFADAAATSTARDGGVVAMQHLRELTTSLVSEETFRVCTFPVLTKLRLRDVDAPLDLPAALHSMPRCETLRVEYCSQLRPTAVCVEADDAVYPCLTDVDTHSSDVPDALLLQLLNRSPRLAHVRVETEDDDDDDDDKKQRVQISPLLLVSCDRRLPSLRSIALQYAGEFAHDSVDAASLSHFVGLCPQLERTSLPAGSVSKATFDTLCKTHPRHEGFWDEVVECQHWSDGTRRCLPSRRAQT
jgi:hypothetical protein